MNNREKIIDYLHYNKKNLCDDCISKLLNIKSRQLVNRICNKLKDENLLQRFKNNCTSCGVVKIINNFEFNKVNNIEIVNNHYKFKVEENDLVKVNLYNLTNFREVNINFIEVDIENLFIKYNKYSVKEILSKSKYYKHSEYISKKYSEYLNYNISEFLIKLKNSDNFDYKLFLNPYGDLKYCKFKINDFNLLNKRGIYIYKVEEEIVYIGRVLDNFKKRINRGYGSITPKNCFLDGQSTNCRINNLINNNKEKIKLFILEVEDIDNIKKIEIALIKRYKPLWNIQGI